MSTAFSEATARRASPTVMLIEPEPMLRLTMTEFLHRSGCQVVACPDAKIGAGALAEGSIHPLLILFGTRVLDAEAARAARQLRQHAREATILGIADVIDPKASADLPPDLRFLAPPFDLPDVLRAVRSHLRRAGYSLPDSELLEA
jgi:DNA-binding response OmpR family regulator